MTPRHKICSVVQAILFRENSGCKMVNAYQCQSKKSVNKKLCHIVARHNACMPFSHKLGVSQSHLWTCQKMYACAEIPEHSPEFKPRLLNKATIVTITTKLTCRTSCKVPIILVQF